LTSKGRIYTLPSPTVVLRNRLAMRENFLFIFAMVQAIGAMFAFLSFFGINWKKVRERLSGKGQIAMFDAMPQKHASFIPLLVLVVGSFAFSALGWYRASQPQMESQRIPSMTIGWSGFDKGCASAVDTSSLSKVRSKYHLFLVCHIIAVSSPFNITGGIVQILVIYNDNSPIKTVAQPGTQTQLSLILLPKDQDGSRIKSLSDVERYGGQILIPGGLLKD
jgi:hypothetical protein